MADDIRNCLECGTEFVRIRRQLYCKKACARAVELRKRPSLAKPPRSVTCPWCSKEFEARYVTSVFCSKQCAKRNARSKLEIIPESGKRRTKAYKQRRLVYRDLVGKCCTDCGEYKLFDEYQPSSNRWASDGLTADCRPCRRINHKMTRYGITREEVVELETAERCEICGTKFNGTNRLHIDHCHATGRVRGALCFTCNTGIGGLKDSPELLRRAADYLLRQQDILVTLKMEDSA